MFQTSANREESNSEKYQARERKFGTKDILPLWVADMDIDTPKFILDALKKRLDHPILGYEEISNSAFQAQINWMKKHHNLELKREEMFFSPSVLTSLNLAIQAFSEEGDKVLIQTPVYPAFASSIVNNQRIVLENPLKEKNGDYGFDFEDLKAKISPRTKLLLLCSPHNPVGRVWKKDELLELASICLEHDIKIIADEIHCDLSFTKHTPFASLSKEIAEQTMTLLSPAKTFNLSGMSISTISISGNKMREQFNRHYKAIHLGEGNSLAHVAFEVAYTHGEEWLSALKVHLNENIDVLYRQLKENNSKISFTKPEATFLIWLDCRNLKLSEQNLEQYFIDAGLGLNRGIDFGDDGKGFMRLNIAISKNLFKKLLYKNLII